VRCAADGFFRDDGEPALGASEPAAPLAEVPAAPDGDDESVEPGVPGVADATPPAASKPMPSENATAPTCATCFAEVNVTSPPGITCAFVRDDSNRALSLYSISRFLELHGIWAVIRR
jgi:hypothetical protein